MSIRLRELIRAVRACKTLAEERETIAKECAAIRTAFKDEDNPYRHRNVAKLLFIHMLGYPTHFGQMECLKLIAGHKFPEKRIGYLGLMLLLDEDTEVLMLVTNSLKNDLGHANQFVVGQALCAMGDIGSADMCRDLAGEVEKLLASSNAYIRKKAVLALLRILRKCPDMVENYVDKIANLLSDRNHGVLVGTLAMLIEVCETEPGTVPSFRAVAPQLLKMLKNLVLSGYAPEHDVSGITDPFLQVKILRALRLLAAGDKGTSEGIADMLAQVATNTESAKNAGNAILYECVLTIVGIEADSGLRVLAVNILGRFLLNRDNNIRYVGLNTLAQVAGADLKAIQRHRGTVVDCLKDPDISIRRRALDLVYLLVNPGNVRPLVAELLNFLSTADVEFKEDLTSKICALVAKQAPSRKFQTDTTIKVLVDAGEYVQDSVTATLPALVAAEPALQAYAVHTLFRAAEADAAKAKLTQIAVWCVGEYGELLGAPFRPADGEGAALEAVPADRVVALLGALLRSSLQPLGVKGYCLTAALKLFARYEGQRAALRALLEEHAQSVVVELQQRAVEFALLTQMDGARLKELTDHMPTPEDEAVSVPAAAPGAGAAPAPVDDLLSLLDGPASSAPPAGGGAGSLLGDIFGGGAPAGGGSGGGGGGGGAPVDLLADLLSDSPVPAPAQPAGGAEVGAAGGGLSMVAYSKNGITARFDIVRHPSNAQLTQITATYLNANPADVTGFMFQAAVPKHAKLQVNAASSGTLPANSAAPVTQVLRVMKAPEAVGKPLVMKLKIDYSHNGQTVSDMAQVDSFPGGI